MNVYATYSDPELLRALRGGEDAAFDTLYERWWLHGIDLVYQRLKDREAARDIVQTFFAHLWTKRRELHIEHFAGYLAGSLRNAVFNYVTRSQAPTAFHEPMASVLMETTAPDQRLLEKNLMELVIAYAQTLPGKRREIFLLHIKERLSTAEIADRLGVSQKTVQNQLRTAILQVQEHLGPAICLVLPLVIPAMDARVHEKFI